MEVLDAGLAIIREAPRDRGTLEMIVARPSVGERVIVETAVLDARVGLIGDTWSVRPSSKTPDGSPHPEKQVTLINARAIAVIAGDRSRWPLAGDQLYVDLDLGTENLPPGTRLAIGPAVIEVTAPPHTGCAKFSARFGADVLRWVNTPIGRALNLRGIHARVVTGGAIARGDTITRI